MPQLTLPITHPDINKYLEGITPPRDAQLQEMEARAETSGFPIVGPLVGRVLAQLAGMIGARRIFEIGSGFGYSAYWFLMGAPPEAQVTLTEFDEQNAELARQWLARGGFGDRVTVEVGDGMAVLSGLDGPFDIIFNDSKKEEYPQVAALAIPKLRKGGLLISDNVLWFGSVATDDTSADVQAIREYTQMVYDDVGLLTTILPLRDGVAVSVKR